METERIVWNNKPYSDWVIVRPTSIWGEWFDTYKDFSEMVMSGSFFQIGKVSTTKTYGYIGNVVYQIDQLLHADTRDSDNKVFYLGDLPAYNIEEWANQIAAESSSHIVRMPYFLIKSAALVGDFLKIFGIHFPMTSFRLKNMKHLI